MGLELREGVWAGDGICGVTDLLITQLGKHPAGLGKELRMRKEPSGEPSRISTL